MRASHEIERKFPFTSSRKRMGCIIAFQGKRRLVEKGASEILLDSCTKLHSLNDEILPLSDSRRNNVLEAIDGFEI